VAGKPAALQVTDRHHEGVLLEKFVEDGRVLEELLAGARSLSGRNARCILEHLPQSRLGGFDLLSEQDPR
jgi:hypothetical protein